MGKKRNAMIYTLADMLRNDCEDLLDTLSEHEIDPLLKTLIREKALSLLGMSGAICAGFEGSTPKLSEDQVFVPNKLPSVEPDAIVPISKEGREAFEQLLDAIGGDNCQCDACQARRAAETPPEKKH